MLSPPTSESWVRVTCGFFMPRHDVTIFNASADEPAGDDLLVAVLGAESRAGSSAVSAQQQSNPIEVDIIGAESVAGAGTLIASTPASSTRYINYRNAWGSHFGSGSTLLYEDSTDDRRLFARMTNFVLTQVSQMQGGVRTNRATEYQSILVDNPLCFMALHDNPWHGTRAYEERSNRVASWRYKYLNTHRREDVIAHINSNLWATELNGVGTPSSGFSQSSVMPNLTDAGFQEWFSDYASDILMGTTQASNPTPDTGDGPDISFSAGYYNDSTQIVSPNISAKAQETRYTGTVQSISIGSGNVVQFFNPGTPTQGGTIGQEVVEEDCFFLNPSGTGFIGTTISSVGTLQGVTQITMQSYPSGPTGGVNQDTVPQTGWKYCIVNADDDTQDLDWDKDGSQDGLVQGSTRWGTGHKNIYTKISEKVEAVHGRRSGFGSNMVNRSFSQWKDNGGWPSPHVFTGAVDYPGYENMTTSMDFQNDGSGNYEFRNKWSPERVMRAIHFAMTYINDSPNDFMFTKTRGPLFECEVAGGYDNLDVTDYYFIEYWWAIVRSVAPAIFMCELEEPSNAVPCFTEHVFLDLDTNLVDGPSFGTYTDGGGVNGVRGPEGGWAWSSGEVGDFTSNGRRIYVRRYGDFLVMTNMTDLPGNYPGTYSPTTYSHRATEDTISAADWTSLYTGGMLAGGETLIRPDFPNYRNTRIENFLQTENPGTWGGFNYGPYEATPFDNVNMDLASSRWLHYDQEGRYEGQPVNTGNSFSIGPMTAEVFQVV